MSWNEKMRVRQTNLRKAYLADRSMTPGVKAHNTKCLREKVAQKPLVAKAIKKGFPRNLVLTPATKAHFTMGTYDEYMVAF